MTQTDRLAFALETGALTLPDDGKIVVLRAEMSAFLRQVPADRLICEQSHRPEYDRLTEQGFTVSSRAETNNAALVVVNLTRSRAENLATVARGFGLLRNGGYLAINGNKTDGVDSLVRQIGKVVPIVDTCVKAHGRVSWMEKPERLPPEPEEWMRAAALKPNGDGFKTAPGMFSPEKTDAGSRLLAGCFDKRIKGRVADLGAGWGWLSLTALAECPKIASIDLYEAEHTALDAARANINDDRAAFHWADITRLDRHAGPYDAVFSNPPFHQGRAAEPELGAAFIAAASRVLKPSGVFFMVANRQLPYEAAFDATFGHWKPLHSDRNFKVIMAARPKRTTGRR